MPAEQVIHIAKKLGYKHRLAYRHVDFINESMLPFHLGIRKTHPLANDLIAKVDEVVVGETFLKKVDDIVSRYR